MIRSVFFALAFTATCSLMAACTRQSEVAVPEPVAEVTTTAATVKDLPVLVTAYGNVEFDPQGQRTLTSEIEARVLELAVLQGDSVKSGDTVVSLDPSSSVRVDVARTRRDANAANAAAERAKRLRVDGLASDADVEASVVAARDLEALATSLESRVGSIKALPSPIDGIVDAILVEPGSIVAPGTALARIASPSSMRARISVEIEDVSELTIGDEVRVAGFDGFETGLTSTIRTIDQRVDAATRKTSIYVVIAPGSGFLPGQAVRAELTVDTRHAVVVVPRLSVFADEVGPYVFVVVNGEADLRRVEPGVTVAEQTEIVSGIRPGDTIVVEGAAILADGMKIRTTGDPNAISR